MANYDSVVAAGIQFLDANYSGDWRKKVDARSLDLASCDVCVLGQIFGSYDTGKADLDIDTTEAKKYGFNTDYDFSALTKAWKTALGADNVLVEKGQIWTDRPGCCAIKVVGTQSISVDNKDVMLYLVQYGSVNKSNGKFTASDATEVSLLKRSDFGTGAPMYVNKFSFFQLKSGMFVTNSTGKVYYIETEGEYGYAREVADQRSSVYNNTIEKQGLRELRLPSGKLFSDTVTK